MSQHRGNDMTTEDSSQDKGHSESPTLPTPTENTDIDLVEVVKQAMYDTVNSPTHEVDHFDIGREFNLGNVQNELAHRIAGRLKAAIEQKLTETRYDPERLGLYVFVGDLDRVNNLDDLYWSYVMEEVARDSASYDHYTLEYCKNNMEYAGFDKVGIHKLLARADQRAKERIVELQASKEGK